MSTAVAVVGGSGFVGSAVVAALAGHGHTVTALPAPRLVSTATTVAGIRAEAAAAFAASELDLSGFDVVVNAAGLALAQSTKLAEMGGANSLLPAVLQRAAREVGAARFVHISSAAVQGRMAMLTEEDRVAPDSAYSRSKALAEQALVAGDWDGTVILRPTSVHGRHRGVTKRLAAIARSPFSVVSAPGDQPTPQVHVESVGRAVELLCRPATQPPRLILQPYEGFTVRGFLELMGVGRRPRLLPARLGSSAVAAAFALARVGGSPVWAQARRAEMILQGQPQVSGWLDQWAEQILTPHDQWRRLALDLRDDA
jgi:nucleoside-diphosphate-sugar epimerase